jgi:outer membrane protein assembly factor BamB
MMLMVAANSSVVALDVNTGAVLWEAGTGVNASVAVTVADGVVLVAVQTGPSAQSAAGYGLAGMSLSGQQLWVAPVLGQLLGMTTAGAGRAFASDGGYVYAFSLLEGVALWRVELRGTAGEASLSPNASVLFVTCNAGLSVVALNATSGAVVWRVSVHVDGGISNAAVGLDSTLYFGAALAVSGATGKTAWENKAATAPLACLASDLAGLLYVGQAASGVVNLQAVMSGTGSTEWLTQLGNGGSPGFAGAPLVGADGTVYAIVQDTAAVVTTVWAVHSGSGAIIWSYAVTGLTYDGEMAMGPDGTLYVRVEQPDATTRIYAFPAGKPSPTPTPTPWNTPTPTSPSSPTPSPAVPLWSTRGGNAQRTGQATGSSAKYPASAPPRLVASLPGFWDGSDNLPSPMYPVLAFEGVMLVGTGNASLVAIDLPSGIELWQAGTGFAGCVSPSVAADSGVVMAVLGTPAAPGYVRVAGFSLFGATLWTDPPVLNGPCFLGCVTATSAGLGFLYDGTVTAYNLTSGLAVPVDQDAVMGGVAVSSNGAWLYVSTWSDVQELQVSAYDVATRAVVWCTQFYGATAGVEPVIGPDGTVYLGSLAAINGATGQLLWSNAGGSALHPSLAAGTGLLYVGWQDEDRYGVPYLQCVQPGTGEVLWAAQVYTEQQSQFVGAPLIGGDGTVYVIVQDTTISTAVVSALDGDTGALLWQYAMPGVTLSVDGEMTMDPGGTLYVRL